MVCRRHSSRPREPHCLILHWISWATKLVGIKRQLDIFFGVWKKCIYYIHITVTIGVIFSYINYVVMMVLYLCKKFAEKRVGFLSMSTHWPGEYSDDLELPPMARFTLYLASLGQKPWLQHAATYLTYIWENPQLNVMCY